MYKYVTIFPRYFQIPLVNVHVSLCDSKEESQIYNGSLGLGSQFSEAGDKSQARHIDKDKDDSSRGSQYSKEDDFMQNVD